MNFATKPNSFQDKKGLLSTLWIFLAANYIYCDHLGLMEPGAINDLLAGRMGSIQVTPPFLLTAALIVEIPILMIILSRVLMHRVNRWVNICAGAIMVLIQVGTMGFGTPPSPVYILYSVIEVICNLIIIGLAWKWRNPEDNQK